MEKKRDSAVEAERDKQQRETSTRDATAIDAKKDDKKKDAEVDGVAAAMPWDADVEHIMERMALFVRELRVSMSHTEFRSLVVSYRELSPMGRRAVANRMQRNHLDALLRALHLGDYAAYQDTWRSDAAALEKAEASVDAAAAAKDSGTMDDGG